MLLENKEGKVIYQAAQRSFRRTLEEAARKNIDLSNINLKKCCFSNACLDDVKMDKACFWGAKAVNVDLSGASLKQCDFRASNFENACLADANLSGSNLSGCFLKGAIVDGTNFSDCIFSCPSIFSLDLSVCKTLKRSVYNHHGEYSCPMEKPPVVIFGGQKRVIILDSHIIIGTKIFPISQDNALNIQVRTLKQKA